MKKEIILCQGKQLVTVSEDFSVNLCQTYHNITVIKIMDMIIKEADNAIISGYSYRPFEIYAYSQEERKSIASALLSHGYNVSQACLDGKYPYIRIFPYNGSAGGNSWHRGSKLISINEALKLTISNFKKKFCLCKDSEANGGGVISIEIHIKSEDDAYFEFHAGGQINFLSIEDINKWRNAIFETKHYRKK